MFSFLDGLPVSCYHVKDGNGVISYFNAIATFYIYYI